MIQPTAFKATQLGIFNPGRLSDEEIERAFIARIPVFHYLFEKIVAEPSGSIPQHHLVVGQRGMGKSTLLHRLAVELRKAPHNQVFIPLTFPEEQYNVDRLSKFWLNCLDALADTLDRAGESRELDALDRDIRQWAADARNISAGQMYAHFEGWSRRLGRRPVLLVDNLGLIFSRISKAEQSDLRALLMRNDAPIMVGASANTLADTVDYGAPFYDAFQMHYLKKLSFEESLEVLRNLAEITGNRPFLDAMIVHRSRLQTLHLLTGGTPRTLVVLYPFVRDGFSADVQTDLESLMDMITPLYKARFEELPEQMQVILDAVALHWDPVALESLRNSTQLENQQLAPQLKRLHDAGWLQRLPAYGTKGYAYELSERFFNIWYLMRRSSRRQKKELLCLTKFLVTLYGEENLQDFGQRALKNPAGHPNRISLQLATADGIGNKKLAKALKNKSYEEILELSKTDAGVLKNFSIPEEFINKKETDLWFAAWSAYIKNQFVEAETKYLEILRINPDSERTWNNLGGLYQDHLAKYSEAERAHLKAITINKNFAYPWHNLGNLYKDYLGKYTEAEAAYLKAIAIDENYANPWYGLGTLYQHLGKYSDAEASCLKAIAIDKAYAHPWICLGNLYQNYMGKYSEAEAAYMKAIAIDEKFAFLWSNLGVLYQTLGRYLEAEAACLKAIDLDEKFASPWNGLGNLYKDYLGRYTESEAAYLKAIDLDKNLVHPKVNLLFLYRDKMNRIREAKEIFEKIKLAEGLKDSYWLNASLFAFYDKNVGIANGHLIKALQATDGKISYETQSDWWNYAAAALRLKYGQAVLETMEAQGYNTTFRPYYEAIRSLLNADSEAYLNSIAAEVREVATDIAGRIRRFM